MDLTLIHKMRSMKFQGTTVPKRTKLILDRQPVLHHRSVKFLFYALCLTVLSMHTFGQEEYDKFRYWAAPGLSWGTSANGRGLPGVKMSLEGSYGHFISSLHHRRGVNFDGFGSPVYAHTIVNLVEYGALAGI